MTPSKTILPVKLTALLLLIFSLSCSGPDTVSPLYFIALPDLRGESERPPTPANFRGSYQFATQRIYLQWDPSISPSYDRPVPLYRIYIYLDGPPVEYYKSQDLLAETGETQLYFPGLDVPGGSIEPFSGNLYFVVTAFSGLTESLPSSTVRVNVFNN